MSVPVEGSPDLAAGDSAETPAEAGRPVGDPRVDAALADLGRLDALPVHEHVAIYEQVHQRLQEALADVDEGT